MQDFKEKQIIKEIETSKFNIHIMETPSGYFVTHTVLGFTRTSEAILDYHTAAYLFEVKFQELEGN